MADATSGILHVPWTAGDQMEVAVEDRLSGNRSHIQTNVVALNEWIFLRD